MSQVDDIFSRAEDVINGAFGDPIFIKSGTKIKRISATGTFFKSRAMVQGDQSISRDFDQAFYFPKKLYPLDDYMGLEVTYKGTSYVVGDFQIDNNFIALFLVKK